MEPEFLRHSGDHGRPVLRAKPDENHRTNARLLPSDDNALRIAQRIDPARLFGDDRRSELHHGSDVDIVVVGRGRLIVAIFMHMAWERVSLIYAILVPPLCLVTLVGLMTIESNYIFLTRILFFDRGS